MDRRLQHHRDLRRRGAWGSRSSCSWIADGKDIVYHGSSSQLFAVPVRERNGGLELGSARPLVKLESPPAFTAFNNAKWTAAPDQGRFLVHTRGATPRALVDLVLDWTSGLKRDR
ncbi:MAG TPA: hypothetical protein VKF32_08975 [Thermoanaerobaculia bacterium]|nr:hypothetical protein [Thermoanaerobaculia bacterium]